MTQKTDEQVENKDAIQEDSAAAATLHPNTKSVADPKSKLEAMTQVIAGIGAMKDDQWAKWFESAMSLMSDVTRGAPNSAEANKATQNMHPSDAEGSGGPQAAMPMVKLAKEDIEKVFAGETLTEEAQEKIGTLFEAAVTARVEIEKAALQEKFEADLTEQVEAFITEVKADLDEYVEYAAETWMKDNEVAVVDTLRAENAEEFMDKLRGLFVESYIDVPEERVDVVREMAEQIDELKGKLDAMINESTELKAQIAGKEKAAVVTEALKDLTLADSEKLKKLIENVEYKGDTADFKSKVELVRETFVSQKDKAPVETSGATETLVEDTGAQLDEKGAKINGFTDPLVAAAARMLDRDAASAYRG